MEWKACHQPNQSLTLTMNSSGRISAPASVGLFWYTIAGGIWPFFSLSVACARGPTDQSPITAVSE